MAERYVTGYCVTPRKPLLQVLLLLIEPFLHPMGPLSQRNPLLVSVDPLSLHTLAHPLPLHNPAHPPTDPLSLHTLAHPPTDPLPLHNLAQPPKGARLTVAL